MGLRVDPVSIVQFTSEYVLHDKGLAKLYEKGKHSQWDARTDIDWTPEVRFGSPRMPIGFETAPGSPLARLPRRRRIEFGWELQAWLISQFLHGEQGALLASARLVETVPQIEAKLNAANQVTDEARHVEVYSIYLNDKLGHMYPMSPELEALLGDIIGETRWDLVYLGMQVLVESLALAAFRSGALFIADPVIAQISKLVAADEARHVAFGLLALRDVYSDLTEAERAEREDFVIQMCRLIFDRFLLEDVWERMDIDPEEGKAFAKTDPMLVGFRRMLFSEIIPNVDRLGLLTTRVLTVLEEMDLLRSA